jgi:hypothetical protein
VPPRIIAPFRIEIKIFIKPIGLKKESDDKGKAIEKPLFPGSSV